MLGCFDHAGFYLRKGRAATTEVLRGYVSFDMAGAVFCALPRMISQIVFLQERPAKACWKSSRTGAPQKIVFREYLAKVPHKPALEKRPQHSQTSLESSRQAATRVLSLRRLSFNGPLRKCGTNALQKRPTRIAQECLLAKKSNKNVCQEFLPGASQILFQECLGMCFTRQKHLIPQHVFVMFPISASFHFEMFIGMYNVLLACNVNAGLRALQCSCLNAVPRHRNLCCQRACRG